MIRVVILTEIPITDYILLITYEQIESNCITNTIDHIILILKGQ